MNKLTIKINNLNLALYKFGTPRLFKEPLFFTTPGWGVSAQEYFLTLDFLYPDYEIYFIETRGCGDSEAPNDSSMYKLNDFANDFEKIRQYFKIEKINLIGHSFGGVLAMNFALNYPDSIGKLIILNSFAISDEDYQKRSDEFVDKMKSEPWYQNVINATNDENFLKDQSSLEAKIMNSLPMYFTDQEALKRSLPSFLEGSVSLDAYKGIVHCYPDFNIDILNQLSKIICETHIICGSDDFVCPAVDNERINKEIKGSNYHLIEGVSHFPWIEKKIEFQKVFNAIFNKQ